MKPELADLAPKDERRMGANPHANGGMLLPNLGMPDFGTTRCRAGAGVLASDTHVLGVFLRDVAKLNQKQRNFRVFGADETLSDGLEAVFGLTNRQWDARVQDNDEFLDLAGRVMEMLSEHSVRAGSKAICSPGGTDFSTVMRLSSTSWIRCSTSTPSGRKSRQLPWRRKIASLNYLLASHDGDRSQRSHSSDRFH